MPNKTGMGGHGKEAFDPNTGKFIEDGKTNVRHPNPVEAQKIAGGVSPQKIQKDSASKMSAPTPNLGDYAKPKKEESSSDSVNKFGFPKAEKNSVLREEFGLEPKDDFAPIFDEEAEQIVDARNGNWFTALEALAEDKGVKLSDEDLKYIKHTGSVPYDVLDSLGYDKYKDSRDEDEFSKDLKKFLKFID